LAKASMWTLDGRRFDAPTFQLGMGPCGSMYSTVLDLGRFIHVLFTGGVAANGQRIVARSTLDSMWTPQFAGRNAAAGQERRTTPSTGFGIGFNIGRLDGHRTIGHGGAIYGFATALLALPDDSLGVVVTATLDGVNAVTDHVARAALTLALDARDGKRITAVDTTLPLPAGRSLALAGRYRHGSTAFD